MTRRRRGIFRPRRLALGDTRPPMLRLLQDCNVRGTIEVGYHEQWRTLFKAVRLGYVDARHRLTEKGERFCSAERPQKESQNNRRGILTIP